MDNGRSDEDLQLLSEQLKKCDVNTVFLIFDRVLDSKTMLDEKISSFIKTKKKLNELGFKVNAWLAPTIGYGNKGSADNNAPEKYTHIVTDKGRTLGGGYCPLDREFVNDFMNTLTELSKTGVAEIMFEDDYTLSGGKMFAEHGCFCKNHMKILRERLGENISREMLSDKLYSPEGIKYRQEVLKVMGETLRDFTKEVEKTIHKVNPDIRIGLSANASSYRMEGITMGELSRLTAGNTKPFIRMTGAPYWDQIPTFATNIEAIRLQTQWLSDSGAELICEGDVYPRPRHWIPAALLEGYDMILRADGKCDGILKYMTDYTSKADYETGYIDRHIKNKPHYEEISHRFDGKKTVGLNVIEDIHTFENASFGDDITRDTYHNYGGFQPTISQWFAVDNSIPVTYGQEGCASIAFGENARYVDDKILKNGVIIDALAAKILTQRGIDVGMRKCKKIHPMAVEYFCREKDYTIGNTDENSIFYDFEIDKACEVLSEFLKLETSFGCYKEHLWKTTPRCPACYFYKNKNGQKFLVYTFVAERAWAKGIWYKGLFRNYYRQAQLCYGIEKLQGKKLPAMCLKNPELYILCKKDNNSMTIGLWNFFADSVLEPKIELDEKYDFANFYNCNGILIEDKIILNEEILPYSFAFITVYK